MEYNEKNFNPLISSSKDKAVTSAAPLCATASASSGTVALSPRSSAFKGSRTAARSLVGVAGARLRWVRAPSCARRRSGAAGLATWNSCQDEWSRAATSQRCALLQSIARGVCNQACEAAGKLL